MRIAAASIVTLWALGQWVTGGDIPTEYSATSDVTEPLPVHSFSVTSPATVATTAVRGAQVQVVATTPPPATTTTTTRPRPTAGDCESYRPWFTPAAAAFFVDGGILERESGCGRDLLNESTGDSGPCQINPVHNNPGWFDGREYGAGGWLYDLHGLTARHQLDNVRWLDACQTLFDVCGRAPWTPPYGCRP